MLNIYHMYAHKCNHPYNVHIKQPLVKRKVSSKLTWLNEMYSSWKSGVIVIFFHCTTVPLWFSPVIGVWVSLLSQKPKLIPTYQRFWKYTDAPEVVRAHWETQPISFGCAKNRKACVILSWSHTSGKFYCNWHIKKRFWKREGETCFTCGGLYAPPQKLQRSPSVWAIL